MLHLIPLFFVPLSMLYWFVDFCIYWVHSKQHTHFDCARTTDTANIYTQSENVDPVATCTQTDTQTTNIKSHMTRTNLLFVLNSFIPLSIFRYLSLSLSLFFSVRFIHSLSDASILLRARERTVFATSALVYKLYISVCIEHLRSSYTIRFSSVDCGSARETIILFSIRLCFAMYVCVCFRFALFSLFLLILFSLLLCTAACCIENCFYLSFIFHSPVLCNYSSNSNHIIVFSCL